MAITRSQAIKYLLKSDTKYCVFCGKYVFLGQDDWHYVRTKRKSDIIFHTECLKKRGK